MSVDQAKAAVTKMVKSFKQNDLTDLIRRLRAAKESHEQEVVNQALTEIKKELKDKDRQTKTVAVRKLIYLQMLGYDISWAAFNIVEVMSQTKYAGKRVGYMAAAQCFTEETDVIMLATNLLKKDFNSGNPYEAGLAINCLSNILTPDLARDLAPDIVTMLASSRPYVKKRAVLVLYKVFLKYPDSLRPSFPRLKARLTDEDPGVVSAAVNVVCELAKRNPKNYLSLAPILFKVLTESQNNWMLIKIVKLLAALTPVEPRLARKLVEPLTSLINATPAMSLLYECIQLCTVGLSQHVPIMRLCIGKLRMFVEDSDQNLKYLGLVALGSIMKIHPKAVAEHRDLILACLDDPDISIRQRALSLLNGLVSKRNLADIARKLIEHAHAAEPAPSDDGTDEFVVKPKGRAYVDDLVTKVIELCSMNSYQHLTDFEWYVAALVELTRVRGMTSGELVAEQFTNVAVRVPSVRPFAVRQLALLLGERRFLVGQTRVRGPCEALAAAAFVCGEYAEFVPKRTQLTHRLLVADAVALPGHVQAHYLQAALKVFAFSAKNDNNQARLIEEMRVLLKPFQESQHLEVQERACFASELLLLYSELLEAGEGEKVANELSALFDETFKPVAAVAQRKVPRPTDLDLDAWIGEPIPDEEEDAFGAADDDDYFGGDDGAAAWESGAHGDDYGYGYSDSGLSSEDAKRLAEQRAADRAANPFILGGGAGGGRRRARGDDEDDDVPGVVQLDADDIGVSLQIDGQQQRRPRPLAAARHRRPVQVIADDELPEGATDETVEVETKKKSGRDDALADIDLSTPLRNDELLKNPTHRVVAPGDKDSAQQQAQRPTRPAPRGRRVRGRGGRGRVRRVRGRGRGRGASRGGASSRAQAQAEAQAKEQAQRDQTSAAAVKATESVVQAATAAAAGQQTALVDENNVRLAFTLRLNAKEPSKIMLLFHVDNNASGSISNVEVKLDNNINLTPVGSGAFKDASIASKGNAEHRWVCKLNDVCQPLRVKGHFNYKNADGNDVSDNFTLRLPVTAFIKPVKIEENEFAALLQRPGLFAASRPVDAADFRAFVTRLAATLRLAVVAHSSSPKVALLYAETNQHHKICIAVRQRENSRVCNVDVKATNKTLSDSLCIEADTLSDAKTVSAAQALDDNTDEAPPAAPTSTTDTVVEEKKVEDEETVEEKKVEEAEKVETANDDKVVEQENVPEATEQTTEVEEQSKDVDDAPAESTEPATANLIDI